VIADGQLEKAVSKGRGVPILYAVCNLASR
jgi:hypothetical protein